MNVNARTRERFHVSFPLHWRPWSRFPARTRGSQNYVNGLLDAPKEKRLLSAVLGAMAALRRDRSASSLRSHRSPYGAGQIVDAEWFSHYIENDVAGQRRQFVVRRCGQHDDTPVTLFTDRVEKSKAADPREHEVEHDDVVGARAEEPQSLRPVRSLFRIDAGSTQYCPDEVPDDGLVLDDENAPLREFHPYLCSAILPEPEHRPLLTIICN
jgi:hypothetical protein